MAAKGAVGGVAGRDSLAGEARPEQIAALAAMVGHLPTRYGLGRSEGGKA